MRRFLLPAPGILLLVSACGRSAPPYEATAQLRVSAPSGGTVQGEGIDCGEDCSATLPIGTHISLAAAPLGARALSRWSGPCNDPTNGTCEFTLVEETLVEASFGFPVTVSTTGDGVGLVQSSGGVPGAACGDGCSVYAEGAILTFAAVPEPASSVAAGWIGTTTGTSATLTVTVNKPEDLAAVFHRRGRALAVWSWGDNNDDVVWSVATDPLSGDVIACGFSQGDVDFGGGNITSNNRDAFVLRRTSEGEPVWQRVLRDFDTGATDEARTCLVDDRPTPGVLVSGIRDVDNDLDVDGDAVADVLGVATNNNSQDGFVARFLFADGTFDWISSASGNHATGDNTDSQVGLAYGGGNVWTGGDIGNNVNGYIQRYSVENIALTQNPQNDTQIGGGGAVATEVHALARDPVDGDVVFTGYFDTAVTFSDTLVADSASRDIFVARGSGNATAQWAIRFGGGSDNDEGEAIAIDPVTRFIAVTGKLDNDVFLAVVDEAGFLQHFQFFEGPGEDEGRAIAWTPDGGLLLAIQYDDGFDLGEGQIPAVGGRDALIARLDADFQLVWTRTFGDAGDDDPRSLTVGPDGSLWVGGLFRNTVALGGDAGEITSNGNADAFLLRLIP